MPNQTEVKVRKIVPKWKRILLGKEFNVGDTIEITKINMESPSKIRKKQKEEISA